LRWSLKPTARKSGWLKKIAEEQGKELPSLRDEPTLFPHLRWIWEAFVYLDRRRPPSFSSISAIPPSEIKAYADLFRIHEEEDREDLACFIGVLDDVMLEHRDEERRAQDAKNKRDSNPRRPPTRY